MNRCLNDNEIAQYADWVAGNDVDKPSEEVKDHVQNCFRCKVEV